MKLLSWLVPQEKQFFDMIEIQSKNVATGVDALLDMLEHYEETDEKGLDEKRRRIKEIESKGDRIVHDVFDELNRTFITPIDREDISALTSSLDDILDNLEAVGERLILYKIQRPPKYMIEFARTLKNAVRNVQDGIALLRDFKNAGKIRDFCKEINTLENEGDTLLRKAMADLFTGKDAIEIIKMKELYDNMEAAIDRCEDVADVMGDILVKYA